MIDLYPLGLEERDRINATFGGGIPKDSIVLLEGGHGAGKSVLTQRMCHGFCESDVHVTYVSTELTAEGFVSQMDSLSYPVVGHLLSEQMLFLHADVDTQDRLGARRGRSNHKRELLTRLMDAETMWRSDVVVLDGFGSLLLHDPRYEAISEANEEDDVIQNLITFFRKIARDKTVVLTVNPESIRTQALRPLRTVADVYLEFQSRPVGNEVRKHMLVRKFAGMGEQVEDKIGFTVQAGRGITIVTRSVA